MARPSHFANRRSDSPSPFQGEGREGVPVTYACHVPGTCLAPAWHPPGTCQAPAKERDRRFDAIVFDLDGTLIDSAGDIADALNRALAHLGKSALPQERISSHIGNGVKRLIESCLKDHGLPADLHFAETRQRFLENYEAGLIVRTRLYPGVAVAIERLRAAGLRLAVLTNKPEKFAVLILKALGLFPFFELVVGEDSLPFKKPHPQSFLSVLRALNVSVTRAAMVGDGPADLRINPGCGAFRVFAAWGINSPYKMLRWDPDLICLRPADLPSLLLATGK